MNKEELLQFTESNYSEDIIIAHFEGDVNDGDYVSDTINISIEELPVLISGLRKIDWNDWQHVEEDESLTDEEFEILDKISLDDGNSSAHTLENVSIQLYCNDNKCIYDLDYTNIENYLYEKTED